MLDIGFALWGEWGTAKSIMGKQEVDSLPLSRLASGSHSAGTAWFGNGMRLCRPREPLPFLFTPRRPSPRWSLGCARRLCPSASVRGVSFPALSRITLPAWG
jgi:hypothetical protein